MKKVDQNIRQINFNINNNENKEYEVRTIQNSAVYIKKPKIEYLIRLYCLIF